MDSWTKIIRLLEAESDNDRPRGMSRPPPHPGSKERAGQSKGPYFPGVHDPQDNPYRKPMGETDDQLFDREALAHPIRGGFGTLIGQPPAQDNEPGSRTGGEAPEDESLNWSKLDRMRNMRRWGTVDRREADRVGLPPIDRPPSPERQAARQAQASRAMASIPQGRDVGSGGHNPLMKPSSAGAQRKRPGGGEDID